MNDLPLPDPPAPPPGSGKSEALERSAGRHPRARQALLVFLGYLLIAFLFYAVPILNRFSTSFAGGGHGDATIYVWCFVWWPHAIGSGMNPFLNHYIWAPSGLNMAWMTCIPGPSLLMGPVTLLWGPIITSNVLAVLSPALGAWAGFLLCRRATAALWPAAIGGYLIGFSSYEVAEDIGHVNLYLMFCVPLCIYLVVRHWQGDLGEFAFMGLLALVLVGEFSVSTEVFATMTLFGVIAFAGLLVIRDMRGEAVRVGLRVAGAYLLAAIVLSPYLYYATHNVPPITHERPASLDLLSFAIPKVSTFIGGEAFRHLTKTWQVGTSEDGGYLGPLVLALVIGLAIFRWRERKIRLLLGFSLIVAVLSLGAHLYINGRPTIPMPWIVFTHVPLLRFALPQRFALYLWIAIGVLAAIWLAEGTGRFGWRYVAAVIAIVMLVPNIWAPNRHAPVVVPAFFSMGLYSRYIAPGETVLILPGRTPNPGQEMLWQSETWIAFRMAQGHTGPQPAAFRNDPVWFRINTNDPGALVPGDLLNFVKSHGVQAVIVATDVERAWNRVLKGLCSTPLETGGVDLFRAPAGGWCHRGAGASSASLNHRARRRSASRRDRNAASG